MALELPEVFADEDAWGEKLNTALTALDDRLATVESSGVVTEVDWDDITDKPAVIAAGTDAAAARAEIGAGTSDLELGTTSTTAKAGDYTPSIADLPAGVVLMVQESEGTWPDRPTSRTDINVIWVGGDEGNPPDDPATGDLWHRPVS